MSIKKNRICMRATRTELRGRNILESLLFLSVDKADTKRGEAKENERAREREREGIYRIPAAATVIYDNKYLITINYIADLEARKRPLAISSQFHVSLSIRSGESIFTVHDWSSACCAPL